MIAPVLSDLAEMRLSTKFPSKQTCRTMQTLKDEEFMFGFKLSCVQISRGGFHAFLMESLDTRRHDA